MSMPSRAAPQRFRHCEGVERAGGGRNRNNLACFIPGMALQRRRAEVLLGRGVALLAASQRLVMLGVEAGVPFLGRLPRDDMASQN